MKVVLWLGPEDGAVVEVGDPGETIEVGCAADTIALAQGRTVLDGHLRAAGWYVWTGGTDNAGRPLFEWKGWTE